MKVIQPRHIPNPIREALALRAVLLRLGFKPTDITAWLSIDRITVKVMVTQSGLHHDIECDTFGDPVQQDFFYDWWDRAVKAWEDRLPDATMTGTSREIIVRKSRLSRPDEVTKLTLDLSETGIVVPSVARRQSGAAEEN